MRNSGRHAARCAFVHAPGQSYRDQHLPNIRADCSADCRIGERGRRTSQPGKDFPTQDRVETYDTYFQEYGAFTESAKEAILLSARLEGLLLDPVYTGKAMAGLIDLARNGVINKDISTIFVHTGGLPILFAYEPQFRSLASCTKF